MLKVSEDGKKAVAVEVNAETDFVAKNEKFQGYVAQVAELALNTKAKRYRCIYGRRVDIQRVRYCKRRTGSSDRNHRREHEHPSFYTGYRRKRFRSFLYTHGR